MLNLGKKSDGVSDVQAIEQYEIDRSIVEPGAQRAGTLGSDQLHGITESGEARRRLDGHRRGLAIAPVSANHYDDTDYTERGFGF